MNKLALSLQILATILLGLMAGFFFAFWVDVAPAMRELDGEGYIRTQQAINRAVRNLPFALAYFGAAIAPVLAAIALWMSQRRRDAVLWIAIGATYLIGVFLLTREINIPINEALAMWNPKSPPADWAAARDRWNEANFIRGIAALLAFAGAALALRLSAPARSS